MMKWRYVFAGRKLGSGLPKHRIKKELPILRHEQFPGQGGKHGYKRGSGIDDNHAYIEVLQDTYNLKGGVKKYRLNGKRLKKEYAPGR